MAGKAPRQKGNRFERELVEAFRAAGLDAFRVPLSGAMRGFKNDIVIRRSGSDLTVEAKCRGSGFAFIYQAISQANILCIKADRQEPLAVMRLSELAGILKQSDSAVSQPSPIIPSKVHKEKFVSDPNDTYYGMTKYRNNVSYE